MQTQYEAVNKNTGEVVAVTGITFNEGSVDVTTATTNLHFTNSGHEVDLQNEEWYLRQVDSHLATDGVTNTDEAGVVTPAENNAPAIGE